MDFKTGRGKLPIPPAYRKNWQRQDDDGCPECPPGTPCPPTPPATTCTSRAWVRNPDWLDLPPLSDGDNIIYVLNAVRDGVPNFFTFYSTIISSGQYTVDLYNDGTAVTVHNHATQADFNLDYAKGTDEVTGPNGDTYKQIITKITGNFNNPYFYKRHPDVSNSWDSPILSVKMASQTCLSLQWLFRGASNLVTHRKLEEFEYVGTCNATSMALAFHGAQHLGKVTGNFEDVTTFQQCWNGGGACDFSEMELGSASAAFTQAFISGSILEMFKADFLKGATSTNATFQSCRIRYFGKSTDPMQMDGLTGATGIYRILYGCNKLQAAYFTSCAPEKTQQAFYQCYALETVSGIDGTNLTNTTAMFDQCHSLSTFEATNMAVSFSLDNCNFNRAGLVNVFNDLADLGGGSATITVTDNPGTGDLTADDLLIATNKGWTVTT